MFSTYDLALLRRRWWLVIVAVVLAAALVRLHFALVVTLPFIALGTIVALRYHRDRPGAVVPGDGRLRAPAPGINRKSDGTRYWSTGAGRIWARSRRDPLDEPPRK